MTKQDDANSQAGEACSSAPLGLLPERDGQPDFMTMAGCHGDYEAGHWYSPAAVRKMLAAERERWRMAVIRRIPAHERFDDQRAAGNTCRAILRDCGA